MKKETINESKKICVTKKGTVDERMGNGGAREKKPLKEIREIIKGLVNDYICSEQLAIDLTMMKPVERVNTYFGLLQYVTPKLSNLDLSATVDVKEDNVDKKLDELDKEEER